MIDGEYDAVSLEYCFVPQQQYPCILCVCVDRCVRTSGERVNVVWLICVYLPLEFFTHRKCIGILAI